MSIEFVDEAGCKAALQDVRSDATPTDWCLFTYENPKSSKIVFLGKGSGGVAELLDYVKDDLIIYGLVRKTDKIDESITVKFAHIMWIGEQVGRMQRARLSVQQGKMREFIGQYHVDLTVSSKNELSDDIVVEKIMDTSGSASRVRDSTGAKIGGSSTTSSTSITSKSGPKGGLEFKDQDDLKESIQEVRRDTSDIKWVLFTYEGDNSNTVILLGKGSGNVDDELLPLLNDKIAAYGLVRKTEKIDESETVKFCFIRFVGDNVHRMLKARLGTHFGAITAFFNPYHVSIDATSVDEISDDKIMNAISSASGTSSKVLKQTVSSSGSSSSSSYTPVTKSSPYAPGTGKVPAVPKVIGGKDQSAVKLQNDGAEIKEIIRDVRNDANDTNWCLVGYENKKGNVLIPLGSGSGGVEELLNHLSDDMVGYALVRKTERIDESITVKFAHIKFIGENIDRMHRARLGTHSGAVTALFTPYHVDMNVTNKSELSDDIVMQKISDASGSASKVKN